MLILLPFSIDEGKEKEASKEYRSNNYTTNDFLTISPKTCLQTPMLMGKLASLESEQLGFSILIGSFICDFPGI